MTVIIGYVDKKRKRTYMGADRCASNPIQKYTIGNSKIYQPSENPNFLLGVSGDPRVGQLFKSFINFPREEVLDLEKIELDDKYIIRKLIPCMQDILLENKYSDTELMQSTILLAYKDKLWMIATRFQLISISDQDFICIGSGGLVSRGVLESIKNIDIHYLNKMSVALKTSTKISVGVEGPYDIFLTGEGQLNPSTVDDIIRRPISEPSIVRTTNNMYIKKSIKENCSLSSIYKLEEGKLHFMTKDMKDVYFMDLDGVLGLIMSNGDIMYDIQPSDDMYDNIWTLVEVNAKCMKTLKMVRDKFKLISEENQ